MSLPKSRLLVALGLAAALPARAGSPQQALSLDLSAGYRGIQQDTAWDESSRLDLTQTLEAAYDGYIIQRSLASYRLGFALDHRTTWRKGERADLFAVGYDGRLKLFEGQLVPVTVYANRNAYDAMQADVPGSRVTTDTLGYHAAFAPPHLPRIQSRGFLRNYRLESESGLEQIRTTDVAANLVHLDDRLLVRGGIDWQVSSRTGSQRRAVTDAELYADYQVGPRTDIVARVWSRTYDTSRAGERVRLETQYSDLLLRMRPNRTINGSVYYRVRRTAFDESRTDEATVGSTWAWTPTPSLSLAMNAGASRVNLAATVPHLDVLEDVSNVTGEFVNSRVEVDRRSARGELRLSAQGGLAHANEIGVGSGLQAGLGARALAMHAVGGALRATLEGNAARQWDGSPQDQTYWATGWRVGVDSGPKSRVDFQISGGQQNIDMSGPDRDSRQFQLTGRAGAPILSRVSANYTLLIYRDVLATDFASGVRHSVRVVGQPVPALSITAMYAFDMGDSTGLDPNASHRVDGTVTYTFARLELTARVSWAHSGGRLPPSTNLTSWVTLSRRFDWSF